MESEKGKQTYELLNIEWHFDYDFEEGHVMVVADGSGIGGVEYPLADHEPSIERDPDGIPMGNSSEDIKIRRKVIYDYFAHWRETHPQESVMNKDLQEPIKVVHLSLSEAGAHSAKSYKSTKAILQLDTILSEARKYGESLTKSDDKNQKNFEKMIIMTHKIENLGLIKLTVGVRRQTHEKIEYGITVPSNDKPFIEPELRIHGKKKKTSHRRR